MTFTFRKIAKRTCIGVAILLTIALTAVHAMDHVMSYSDEEIKAYFSEKDTSVNVYDHDYGDGVIRVVEEGVDLTDDSLLIVFVHGAPGDHSAFNYYMEDKKVQDLGLLVSYDRPGYGKSSKSSMTSIDAQADVLIHLIKSYDKSKALIIGHSYGGPIVANALARYPDVVDAGIMIAPLIDPDNEPIFWFSYLAKWKLTKWMLPRSMRVAGDEKFSHAAELSKMEHLWKEVRKPLMHIHGVNDMLAPASVNIAWSKKQMTQPPLQMEVVEEEGHLIIWQGYRKVRDLITEMVGQICHSC